MKIGYYWPSMHIDAKAQIQRCEACQIHSLVPRNPKQEMTSIILAWPFSWWGIDIVGPLLMALGGARFLVVAIDYFTKWVEAKPLVSIIGKHMEKFVWEHIYILILYLSLPSSSKWTSRGYKLRHHQRMTPKSNNWEIPFSLTYGTEAIVPTKISVETKRIKEFEARQKDKICREDLDILEE
ncbi:reverse transcriptase domain-containing protein [Tanacetum coccineum]